MKFVHIADLHFDCAFTGLASKDNMADIRRLEQRKAFRKVIEYIKENNINYLFISGDLYEDSYVKKGTIMYINELFEEIPNTSIFISPGNHDPYIKGSWYESFKFSPNVHIFKGDWECIQTEEANIYGMGFNDYYCNESNLDKLKKLDNDKPNIAVLHASLNSAVVENSQDYNPISEKRLQELEFEYIALGHIHKRYIGENNGKLIVYPGSLISLGFDELGEHGMITGEIEKGKANINFIKLDDTEFTLLEQNVENFNSKEDIVEHLDNLKLDNNKFYEIVLVGNRNCEINTREILKLISNDRILKIKDTTNLSYDLETLSKENTLKGLFVKEALEKLENEGESSKEEILKAIEIGLNTL